MAGRGSLESVAILLALLDEAYDRPAWHGPNLRGALRGLTPEVAAWVPGPGRNSIWAIALHCAYWKHATRRRITGEGARGSFPRRGSNWLPLPKPADAAAWKADVALLDDTHRALRAAVAGLAPSSLEDRRGTHTVARLAWGIAAHDLYHAGQIRLLIKLAGGKPRGRRGGA